MKVLSLCKWLTRKVTTSMQLGSNLLLFEIFNGEELSIFLEKKVESVNSM